MGFYGNITNTSRTQFQFDLVYPSRYKMETQCSKDGVYVGRYVLVEYDSSPNNVIKDGYRKGLLKDFKHGDFLYASKNLEEKTIITYFNDDYWDYDWSSTDVIEGVIEGSIVRVKENKDQYADYDEDGNGIGVPIVYAGGYSFFECIGFDVQDGMRLAIFKKASAATDNYTANYEEDKRAYPTAIGRGWDSTVWQKVYENGKEKYVMIAELNSVIPTFDIQADAPSMSPITPHFDEGSTNVYYKLHWQPQWGLRTRAASGELKTYQYDKNGKVIQDKDPIFTSTDILNKVGSTFPSDTTTKWEKYEYDTIDGTQAKYLYNKDLQNWEIPVKGKENDEKYQIPAAIFFNKLGFSEKQITNTHNLPNLKNDEWDGVTDFISIKPTGWSGHQYSAHNSFKEMVPNIDTQELTVMLPSIGNTISEVWDLVYGGLSTNANINQTQYRNRNIDWENPEEKLERLGLRLINDKYEPITADQLANFKSGQFYYYDKYSATYILEENNQPVDGQTYYARSGGYTFDKSEVTTLAGCINSVHDLMGMIIIDKDLEDDPDDPDFSTISSNFIYYFPTDGTYRIRSSEYHFDNLEESDFEYILDENASEENFSPYLYWEKNADGTFIPSEDSTYIEGTDYYLKQLNTDNNSLFEEIEKLDSFETGYYRANTGSFIYKENGAPDDGVVYYDIFRDKLGEEITFTENYLKNKFYYKNLDSENKEYILMQTDLCDRTKAPFYVIPQETGEKNHPFLIPISNMSNYNPKLENPPQEPGASDSYRGPYYSAEGFWDSTLNKWMENEYVWPVYFFTPGAYWRKYLKDEQIEEEDQEAVDNVFYRKLIAVPDDGFGYILDRPRANTDTPDEEPVYGNALGSYKVKLIDYDTLTENVKKHLFYAETEPYFEEVEKSDGSIEQIEKTRFLRWLPVTREHINEWFSSLGLRQGNKDTFEPELLMPKQTIYYIETTTEENGVDEGLDKLFEANRYYYIGNDGLSYIKDRKSKFSETSYYDADKFIIGTSIIPQGDGGKYYYPNKYYYFDDILNKYVIDSSAQARSGVTYFTKNDVYVSSDSSNTFQEGTVWNLNVLAVPNSIILSKRRETPYMKELDGFGRSFNTINGLILQINRLVEANNFVTRDRNTLQGAINYLNDIIVKLDALTPGDFPVVDYFGRLHGAHAKTDKWLDVTVDPNVISPKLVLTHTYNPEDVEPVVEDMNTTKTNSITTPHYVFDEMGHKTGESTRTITLPHNFVTLTGSNSSVTTNAPYSITNKIIATSAQDEIAFAASNKWIKIDTATNKTLKFGHIHSGVTAGSYGLAQNETLGAESTLEVDKIFEVPYFTVDEAGHVTAASTKTVAMPTGFKSFAVGDKQTATTNAAGHNAATASATEIEDIFTFNAGNTWIELAMNKSAAGEDASKSMIISHSLSALAATNIGDNTARTPGFGETFNTVYLSTDNAGHLTAASVKTVRIPGLGLTKDTATNKNVLIGLDYNYSQDSHDGTFTEVKSALGDLSLSTYTPIAGGNITANDTLKGALGKLETSLSVINGDASTTGSIAAQIQTLKTTILDNCSDDFNSLAKIESWVSDKTEGEPSIISRVKTLEDKALPDYADLVDNEVYLMKMISGKPTWINLASWTGGKY